MTNQHPITPVPELAYQWRPISKKFARWVLEDSEGPQSPLRFGSVHPLATLLCHS